LQNENKKLTHINFYFQNTLGFCAKYLLSKLNFNNEGIKNTSQNVD